ncbi:hypothetical protein GGR58DRAFT_58665 [Xylaria digitata]|nr:hypothetical protein GGR58DRAFT_58665 [Xylaria digitata]
MHVLSRGCHAKHSYAMQESGRSIRRIISSRGKRSKSLPLYPRDPRCLILVSAPYLNILTIAFRLWFAPPNTLFSRISNRVRLRLGVLDELIDNLLVDASPIVLDLALDDSHDESRAVDQDVLDEFQRTVALAHAPARFHDDAHWATDAHPDPFVMVHELLVADDVAAPHWIRHVVDDLVDLDDGPGALVCPRLRQRLYSLREIEVLARHVHRRWLLLRLWRLGQRLVGRMMRVAE